MMVTMRELDEWLFKGLGGIVNMLIRRIKIDTGFSERCRQMLHQEILRLLEVKEEVDSRVIGEYPTGDPRQQLGVDVWFTRSYEGINSWLSIRSQQGPPIDAASLDQLQAHITRIQEVIDHERRRV